MVDEILRPLDSIVAWLDAMAPELRDKDFLPQVLIFTPRGLLYQEDALDPWQDVRTRIGTLPPDPFSQMPTVLALKSAIDMVFHGRATKADWADNKRKYSWIVEHIEAKGNAHLAEKLRENGEKMPFMAAHWIRAAETWQALRSDKLTLDALDGWLRSYRPSDG